jgi:hypothetical protein
MGIIEKITFLLDGRKPYTGPRTPLPRLIGYDPSISRKPGIAPINPIAREYDTWLPPAIGARNELQDIAAEIIKKKKEKKK